MVTGRNLLGHDVPAKMRVWYWNGEDPKEEIERRIAAICLHYGIKPEDIGDRLFIDSGRDTEIKIARDERLGFSFAVPTVDAIKRTIVENQIDVMIVDPFVSSHAVTENDNTKIDAVAKAWGRIAGETNCAIELSHHTRKGAHGQFEHAVEDARGAS
jgi:RecA-family ATPase